MFERAAWDVGRPPARAPCDALSTNVVATERYMALLPAALAEPPNSAGNMEYSALIALDDIAL